jgi:hypothetical protein
LAEIDRKLAEKRPKNDRKMVKNWPKMVKKSLKMAESGQNWPKNNGKMNEK